MKHLRHVLISLWLCLLLAGISSFPMRALANGDEMDFKTIDKYIVARMRSERIPGLAIVIVKGNQVVYSKGYGDADQSGHPVIPQTPFIIGSISKPFTALAVMQLVEAGKVELDVPVQRYIPWFRVADSHASAQITVRQLLDQTSGLPQILDTHLRTDQDAGALERTVRSFSSVELARPIGTFGYSNANYQILGLIVQVVSDQPYEDYVKQHIFIPLDMKNSFASQEDALQHGMALGHRWWFGLPVPVTLPYNRTEVPSGYLISSAEDMAHFLIAQMNGGRYENNPVLSPEGIALAHAEATVNPYAMGWESVQVDGHRLINHDGGVANFQASIFFDPEERMGVFVAANVMSALDAFSSPPGSAPLDGTTTRGMAESILSLAMNQLLPEQGLGNAHLYLIFDLVLLALTIGLIVSLARIPRQYQLLAQRGIASRSGLMRRTGLIAILHFAWPLFLLYLTLNVFNWKVLVLYQPDLGTWLDVTAVIVFLKGTLELALTWRAFKRAYPRQSLKQA